MAHELDHQVFLIDEDEVVRDSLKVLLESHGVQVRDFRSAAEFLSKAKATGGGCLVLGCHRHIVDGVELIGKLQRQHIAMPVIFIVGGGDAATKAAVLAAGAFAYLERPIEETALIRAIRAALAYKGGRNPAVESANAPAPLPARS